MVFFFSILSKKFSTSNVRFITCNLKYYFFSSEMIPKCDSKSHTLHEICHYEVHTLQHAVYYSLINAFKSHFTTFHR